MIYSSFRVFILSIPHNGHFHIEIQSSSKRRILAFEKCTPTESWLWIVFTRDTRVPTHCFMRNCCKCHFPTGGQRWTQNWPSGLLCHLLLTLLPLLSDFLPALWPSLASSFLSLPSPVAPSSTRGWQCNANGGTLQFGTLETKKPIEIHRNPFNEITETVRWPGRQFLSHPTWYLLRLVNGRFHNG